MLLGAARPPALEGIALCSRADSVADDKIADAQVVDHPRAPEVTPQQFDPFRRCAPRTSLPWIAPRSGGRLPGRSLAPMPTRFAPAAARRSSSPCAFASPTMDRSRTSCAAEERGINETLCVITTLSCRARQRARPVRCGRGGRRRFPRAGGPWCPNSRRSIRSCRQSRVRHLVARVRSWCAPPKV